MPKFLLFILKSLQFKFKSNETDTSLREFCTTVVSRHSSDWALVDKPHQQRLKRDYFIKQAKFIRRLNWIQARDHGLMRANCCVIVLTLGVCFPNEMNTCVGMCAVYLIQHIRTGGFRLVLFFLSACFPPFCYLQLKVSSEISNKYWIRNSLQLKSHGTANNEVPHRIFHTTHGLPAL